jgi:hypothetical protein
MTAQEITEHDVVTPNGLKLLAGARSPCITMIIQVPNPLEVSTRLKNAIRTVKKELENTKTESVDTLLEPLRELAATAETVGLWSKQMIVFRSPDVFRYFLLHGPVQEMQVVQERFQVRPLLSALTREQRFHLLGLSRRHIRLFHCTQHRVEEVNIHRVVPQNLRVWLNTRKPDHVLDNRANAGPSVGTMKGVVFGTNTDREREDEYLAHFFKEVDKGINSLLRGDTAPLLLAGIEDEVTIYRRVSTHPRLLDKYVHGSPDALNDGELRRRAMGVVMGLCSEPLQKALADFEKQRDRGRVSLEPLHVIKSAWEGRVADLFMSETAEVTGKWNDEAHGVESGRFGEDLLNAAALQTVLHGGRAFMLEVKDMPVPHDVAAVLRF